MNQPPHYPARFIGNLAALVLVAIGAAYLIDKAAAWLGWQTRVLCSIVDFFVPIAVSLGVILATLGVVIWAISRFRSDIGLGFIIGGLIFGLLPQVMPHYFGVACIPNP